MSSTTGDDMRDDDSDVFAQQTPMRGVYFERAMRAKRLVEIDASLLEAFADAKQVNAALGGLAEVSKPVKLAV